MIKPRRMSWASHGGDDKCKIVVGKPEGRSSLKAFD
jgi:hypothetical protein